MAKESDFFFDRNVLKTVKKFNTFQTFNTFKTSQALEMAVNNNHYHMAMYFIDLCPEHLIYQLRPLFKKTIQCKNKSMIPIFFRRKFDVDNELSYFVKLYFINNQSDDEFNIVSFILDNYIDFIYEKTLIECLRLSCHRRGKLMVMTLLSSINPRIDLKFHLDIEYFDVEIRDLLQSHMAKHKKNDFCVLFQTIIYLTIIICYI